ncbi:MAG: hypothetical protein O3A51_10755, partial [Verrucomicrobia bacterium]|nr:hypothetical protein [Verrucomicrobiota bacterium]
MKRLMPAIFTLLFVLAAFAPQCLAQEPAPTDPVAQGLDAPDPVVAAPIPTPADDDEHVNEAEDTESRGIGGLFKKKLEMPKLFRGKTDEERAQEEAERTRQKQELQQAEAIQSRQREQLAEKENRLAERRKRKSDYHLREVIGSIDRDEKVPAARVLEHQRKIDEIREKRSQLDERLLALERRADADPEERLKAEESFIQFGEEVVLHSMEIDRWEMVGELAKQATRIAEATPLPANPRPTLKTLVDKKRNQDEERKRLNELTVTIEEFTLHQGEILAVLELLQERLTHTDEQIKLGEEKYALTKSRDDKQTLSMAKVRRGFLTTRIDILKQQSSVVVNTIDVADKLVDLYEAFLGVLKHDYRELFALYQRSIMVPLSMIAVVILVYFAISRTLLPLIYRRDRLFIARRLGRYFTVLMVFIVILGFLFEDL